MNPLAICALLGLGCAAPPKHAHVEVLGMVAGHAREVLEADWAKYENDSASVERAYVITKDSVDVWRVGETDSLVVLFVLEVEPMHALHATPLSFAPSEAPSGPMLHTHQSYCDMTSWGFDYTTCSNNRPESNQCRPSFTDERTQIAEGHAFDFIQCGPRQFILYLNPELTA